MTDAVIVSTARTPLAKSWRGAFNMTHGATLGGHAVQRRHRARRHRRRARSTTCSWAARMPEGATGCNIARQIALRAGCPVTVPRHDGQPLLLVAACRRSRMAAQRIIAGEGDVYRRRRRRDRSPACRTRSTSTCIARRWLAEHKPEIYWPMLQTAETVAKRYNISRERRTSTACKPADAPRPRRRPGRFNDEIVPITVDDGRRRQGDGAHAHEGSDRRADEGIRAGHDLRRRREDQAGDAGRRDRGRQRQPVLRRRRRLRRDERRRGGEARPEAARHLPRLRRRRLRARRDGHRPGVRRAEAARSAWA